MRRSDVGRSGRGRGSGRGIGRARLAWAERVRIVSVVAF